MLTKGCNNAGYTRAKDNLSDSSCRLVYGQKRMSEYDKNSAALDEIESDEYV